MHTMSKEKFQSVMEYQLLSGLSVSDFCHNENYPVSTFYYWRRKFGFSASRIQSTITDSGLSFAPVRIEKQEVSSTPFQERDSERGEILVELPTGIKIYFRGQKESHSGLEFITQIVSRHVLPE